MFNTDESYKKTVHTMTSAMQSMDKYIYDGGKPTAKEIERWRDSIVELGLTSKSAIERVRELEL